MVHVKLTDVKGVWTERYRGRENEVMRHVQISMYFMVNKHVLNIFVYSRFVYSYLAYC